MAEYCLRWNNHQPNLVTVFSELLNAESLVDVTLATDGHFIHAHKLVLSACSVYFKDLFGSNPCKHPIVFLKDIRIEDLKTVIDFIYRGEVNVSQERLQDVLKTAESLRIKGLADKPFSYDEYPSQSRGKHLSSSLSSQRSSLTDSREQPPSVDTEDCLDPANNNNNNNNNNANSPPASKKRKVAASQDSSESFHQDTNHEGEEQINDVSPRKCSIPASVTEARTPPIDKIKVEEPEVAGGTADTRPEYQESRAADAMLLLQGSSSEGGEEGGGVALPPTTVSRGDSSSSSLVSSHSQGRPKRAMLQRQPGIIREGVTEEPQEEPVPPSPEYIVPESITLTLTTEPSVGTSSSGGPDSLILGASASTVTTSSHHTSSAKMLQVPAVVVGSHQDKTPPFIAYGSVGCHTKQIGTTKPLLVVPTSGGRPAQQVLKQRSQPELSTPYAEGAQTPVKKLHSHPTVLTHTPPSSAPSDQASPLSPSTSAMTYIPMPLIKKQRSSPGSLASSTSHLRPIQPKPPLGLGGEKDLPVIQFTMSDDEVSSGSSFQPRFPRAISEEPVVSRGSLDLLSPVGGVPLTQSVSQDTGLDGGMAFMNRIIATAPGQQPSHQSLSVPKLSTGSVGCTAPSTSSTVAHAPVLREGPALGCNFCWNSQDTQGRVQRRKTKYHCPACRTNLCIVPCFHEYHNQMQMQQDQHKQFTKILTKTSST